MAKPNFTQELADIILTGLATAPESQVERSLKEKIITFNTKKSTLREKFDFLSKLSKQPTTEVSSFVQALCAVDMHYESPQE
jgi:hypothetical protein